VLLALPAANGMGAFVAAECGRALMLALMLGLVPGAGATHPDTVEFLGWCIFTVHIVIMLALMCALAYSLLGAFGLLGAAESPADSRERRRKALLASGKQLVSEDGTELLS